MNAKEALERVVIEAQALASQCPPAPHACSACEILHVARLGLADFYPNKNARFGRDGDKWSCVEEGFVNLQESPCGLGETPDDAYADLMRT